MTRRASTIPPPLTAVALATAAAVWLGSAAPAAEDARARKDGPRAAIAEPPAAYRGAALPLQARDTASLLARAEEHFAGEDWARGFAVLDEVLTKVTAPRGRRVARARPAAAEPAEDDAQLVEPAGPGQPGEKPKDPDVDPADEMHSRDGILFVPVADHARRRLSELPPEARAVYRSTYEAPAREALNRAKSLPLARAFAELRRTAERYPLTVAGAEAWSALSERLLGAGRPAEAARALEARLEIPGDEPAQRATLLAQIAVASLLARQPDAARRALDAITRDHPEAMVQIRGESIRGKDLPDHPFFRALLAGAERKEAAGEAGSAWVSEGGSFDHAAYPVKPEDVPPLGSRARWIYPPPANDAQAQSFAARGVSYGQAAYTRNQNELIAIDARSGKRLWAAQTGTSGPAGGQGRVRVFVQQGQPMLSDLSLTVIPPIGPGERAMVVGIDGPPQMSQTTDGRTVFAPNLLVACDAVTGKLLWTVEGEPRREDEENPEGALAFAAPPVVAGGLLVAPALKGDSLHAVGLSTRGKVRWTRRLYAYNQAYYMRYGFEMSAGSSFAASAGLVAAASGHGMACVLDAASGTILWASRYRSDARVSGHAGQFVYFDSNRSRPPLITGDVLVSFPPDGDHVTAFDLRSGAVRWERRIEAAQGQFLLGADRERAYLAGEKVRALRTQDGTDAWETEAIGPPSISSGVVMPDRILVAAGASRLTTIEPETGKVAPGIRIFDPRVVTSGYASLFLAHGQILAAVPGKVVAFEPQDASWKAIGDEAEKSLHERAQLLRSEGRHAEAIAALDQLLARVRSEDFRDTVEREIVIASRGAAEATGKASFITDLLARSDPIVKERREVVALRLVEAGLLEKEGAKDAAAAIYKGLLGLEGFLATSPESFEVDAGAYASDALRDLRAAGVDVQDPSGEARARALLSRKPAAADLSRIVLRRSHLDAAREAGLTLARAAESEGDSWRAAEVLALALDGARPGEEDSSLLASLRAAVPQDAPAAGLADLLGAAGGKPLRKMFWISSEEGFLAATAPGSLPLPALIAIAKTSARLYGADGKLILERPLPDYPDVSDLKISLQSHVEEPAVARAYAGHVLLFTAAGLYDFGGIGGGDATVQAKDFKLRWTSPWRHTFAEMPAQSHRFGWGNPIAQGENTFPELGAAPDGDPIILFRDGSLVAFDARTGKRRWRSTSEAYGAASPPVTMGSSIVVATARPPGVTLHRGGPAAPGRAADGESGRKAGRHVPGPERNVASAEIAAGGLAAAFSGQGLEVNEVETGRLLWRRPEAGPLIVHATSSEVWLSEPGKLVCRSVRSGRERRSIPLPESASVVDVLSRRGPSDETILVVSRGVSVRAQYWGYYSRSETGTDLSLVTIDAGGKKAREVEIHKGPVTYDGGCLVGPDGRLVLFFNGATEPEKWYTRAVLFEPSGEVKELLTAEIQGKGTGQPPRLAVLRGGLGVGNAGGFGWYAPENQGAPDGGIGSSPPPAEGAGASTKEPDGR